MENSLLQNVYNPDVLSCIANLSSDEVFTPPALANKMIDMLPQELFENPDTTFLDPCCKSGVFLREIAKRLIKGLEPQFPDLEKRVEHIFTKQLFGVAITELTSLLSRRSVYCSKYPSSQFSAYRFPENKPQGNIIYQRINHTWQNGKCIHCGASQNEYDRDGDLETYAYLSIHNVDIKKLFNMKFDVIIGNPPYQLSDGGGMRTASSSGSSIPLYNKFVDQAKKLNPRYLCMIIPARWFSGGRNLDSFRNTMLSDSRLTHIVDYANSKDCFPGVEIPGGICYFLWERDNRIRGCNITNIFNGKTQQTIRDINEFPVFVRFTIAVEIIRKVLQKKEIMLSDVIFSSKPFGFRSFEKGKQRPFEESITLLGSSGNSYVSIDDIRVNKNLVSNWKVIISKTSAEHAGEADKNGQKRVLSRLLVLPPNVICSETYLLISVFDNEIEAKNMVTYMKTRFFRFLVSTILLTQNIAKDKFQFVPLQDFSHPWTDEMLYKKYNLTQDEINFIESMIKPME